MSIQSTVFAMFNWLMWSVFGLFLTFCVMVAWSNRRLRKAVERVIRESETYTALEALSISVAHRRCFDLISCRSDVIKAVPWPNDFERDKVLANFGTIPSSVREFFSKYARVMLFESLTLELQAREEIGSNWVIIGEDLDFGTYSVKREGDAVFNLDHEIQDCWVKASTSIYHLVLVLCAEYDEAESWASG